MTTTVPAGIPAQPDQPPTIPAVDLTKTPAPEGAGHDQAVPGDGAQPAGEERRGLGSRLKAGAEQAADADGPLATHLRRAARTTGAWLRTDDLTEEDVAAAVLEDRRRQHKTRETQLRQELARISSQIVTAKRTETSRPDNDPHRDGDQVVQLKGRRELVQAQLTEHQELAEALGIEPTEGEVSRARWSKRAGRAAALVGGVVGGGVVLPMQDPRLLLVSIPAGLVALWRAGSIKTDTEDSGKPVALGQVPAKPGTGSPAPAGKPAETATSPLAAFVAKSAPRPSEPEVPGQETPQAMPESQAPASPEAEIAALARQSAVDMVTDALVKGGVVPASERGELTVVSVTEGSKGWTAMVDLPRGKSAADAIEKADKVASGLRVKGQQLQLTVADDGEDGHSGRLQMWVSYARNPFGGDPIVSELVDAELWDLWRDGIPMGTDARGDRHTLRLLWQSWMLGGNPGQGKSYLARLAAAAGALDPTVRIHTVTGKDSPDWDALGEVAHSYIKGNTQAEVLAVYTLLEDLIRRIQAKGAELSRLFKEDTSACPEGKLTKELSQRPGLEVDLLIVDELQELLDAAVDYDLVEDADTGEMLIKRHSGRGEGNAKDAIVSRLARHIKIGRFVASLTVLVTQRPDAESIPGKLRGVASLRSCQQVTDWDAACMVLTKGLVAAGATPHLFPVTGFEGVTTMNLGETGRPVTLKADMIDLPALARICTRGRDLRQARGTLTGHAARQFAAAKARAEAAEAAERERLGARMILLDVREVMKAEQLEAARTETLARLLAEAKPTRYEGMLGTQIAEQLRKAGAGTTVRIPGLDGMTAPSGYRLDAIEAALSA